MAIQINVKFPENFYHAAQSYADTYGYRNIQDLLYESLREKLYEKSDFDESFSKEEINLLESLVEKSLRKGRVVDEKTLKKALQE